MKKIDFSIIIVSYNTNKLLDKCLSTVFQNMGSLTIEVIVVDNGSTDGSQEMISKKYPQVHLIKNQKNIGYGQANNQGVRYANSDTILIINSDIEVQPDALEFLYRHFLMLPSKSILGAKLFNTDGTPQPSAGPKYSLTNIFVALFLKGDYLNLTRYSPNHIKKVDWVMGACMMFSKKSFSEVGGFDEGIFMYMEEIDWQYRAQQIGYQIYFYPDAHFMHVGAGSSQGRSTPILNVFRGFLYYYKKHHNGFQLIILRVILLLKSIVATFLFGILSKKEDQKMYIEAFSIVKNFK